MARTAKEILKARGYTDDELKAMDTLLKDRKFTAAIEAEAAEVERLNDLVTQTEEWYEKTSKPAMEKAVREANEAAARAAAAEARWADAQKRGLLKIAADPGDGGAGGGSGDGNDPNKGAGDPNANIDPSKYVTRDTLDNLTGEFASRQAEAMVMYTDILEDHRDLFGSRLPGGMSGLRAEYANAQKTQHFAGSMRDFWEQRYNVAGKREELSAKAKEEERNKIREEERAKLMDEVGNPNLRPGVVSRSPFVVKKDDEGKVVQPWERAQSERSGSRVARLVKKEMAS